MVFDVNNDWKDIIGKETQTFSFSKLQMFLNREYELFHVLPNKEDIFKAYKLTPYKDVKVVIIGQDPYHTLNKGCGLAFSVPKDEKIPATLDNIFKELNEDVGTYIPNHGCLDNWAKQGVFLLNTILTVRQGIATSHKNTGWEIFTNKTIAALNNHPEPLIFVLWGNTAKSKESLITNEKHIILKGFHPSPLSAGRGFFGCKHFSTINRILVENIKAPIDWQIDNI